MICIFHGDEMAAGKFYLKSAGVEIEKGRDILVYADKNCALRNHPICAAIVCRTSLEKVLQGFGVKLPLPSNSTTVLEVTISDVRVIQK